MKNGANYKWNRRDFIKTTLLSLAAIPFIQSCTNSVEKLIFKITGTNHILGHRLRTSDFPKPTKTINENIVIIGGGISGLSAARYLSKNGINDFKVIELENEVGGNSSAGENSYSKYPFGAHYLPLPNHSDNELISFLNEENIITHFEDENPIFNEAYLCFDPHERLFIKNYWQEGIIPKYGLNEEDFKAFEKFDELISELKTVKGNDNLFAFDIPINKASKDEQFTNLDKITLAEWLIQNNLNNEHLNIYLNYCCKDDYGIGVKKVSAWAGLHYFCGRKNSNHNVLTWPEGNQFLVEKLAKYSKGKELKNELVYQIEEKENKVHLLVYDSKTNESKTIIANQVIVATPQFVNKYLIKNRKDVVADFEYAPWLTATIVVKKIPLSEGAPLSWDNVIHNGFGLGYIYNQHQHLHQYKPPFVLTYYAALSEKDLMTERRNLYSKSDEYWKSIILSDLEKAHYGITNEIESIEIHKKGHGMISPFPNFIFSEKLKQASQNTKNLYFAHSDLSGISIFEEAFHQGINAAKKLIDETTLDT